VDNTGCYAFLSFLFYHPSELSRVHAGFVSSARGCDSLNICRSMSTYVFRPSFGYMSKMKVYGAERVGVLGMKDLFRASFFFSSLHPGVGVFLTVRWHQPFFDSICDIFRLYAQLHFSCPCDISFCNIGVCNSSCGYQL
jgi:hypothetical protein